MRRSMRAVAAALGALLLLPGVASASASSSSSSVLNPPVVPVRSLYAREVVVTPTHVYRFADTGLQALHIAESTSQMQALHRREHPLHYTVDVWAGASPSWDIFFAYKGNTVANVAITPTGHVTGVWQGPLAIDPAGRGGFPGPFNEPWVVLTFSLLFLVPFVNPRRLRRAAPLDALLLLASFGVPYFLFDHGHFVASVWLVYPGLLLLLVRMLWLGLRQDRPGDGHEPQWPIPMLVGGVLLLAAARVVLDLVGPPVIDVGAASVIGAHLIAHGEPLYAYSASHGDTYGPIAYLAYVPFEHLWPWTGVWNYLPAARAAAIFFDLATVAGLFALGLRLRPGAAGRRLGLALAWAWCASPVTLFALMNNTNDGLIALLFVIGLLAYASPVGRGVALGLATAAKLFPAILLPLFAAGWRKRSARDVVVTCLIFALVVVASFAPFVPAGGLHEIYERTIGYQLDRQDIFSVWALHPSLKWLKTTVEALVCLGAVAVFFLSPRRTIAAVAAIAAALTVAVQLPAEHWFYFYLEWTAPFALVAVLARPARHGLDAPAPEPGGGVEQAPSPLAVPAG